MANTYYTSVHESSSNQHCHNLAKWLVANGKEPDSKSTDPEEQFLGKFLERKRAGRAKPYDSDQEILNAAGFPNLFERSDSVGQQVRFAHEVCKVLKETGGKIPSRIKGDSNLKQIGHWIRNRRAAAHGALHLNIPEEVLEVFKKEGYLHVLHMQPAQSAKPLPE